MLHITVRYGAGEEMRQGRTGRCEDKGRQSVCWAVCVAFTFEQMLVCKTYQTPVLHSTVRVPITVHGMQGRGRP